MPFWDTLILPAQGYSYWASYITITNANKNENPVRESIDVDAAAANSELVFSYGNDLEAQYVLGVFSKIKEDHVSYMYLFKAVRTFRRVYKLRRTKGETLRV